jgi:hypothetical protein
MQTGLKSSEGLRLKRVAPGWIEDRSFFPAYAACPSVFHPPLCSYPPDIRIKRSLCATVSAGIQSRVIPAAKIPNIFDINFLLPE